MVNFPFLKHEAFLQSRQPNLPVWLDVLWKPTQNPDVKLPIVLFIHGFKGFKDWGPFWLIQQQFAEANFVFAKMNVSHSGIRRDFPSEILDLEAFAANTFTLELDDIGLAIDYLLGRDLYAACPYADINQIYILGHSRGGALAILKAYEDHRITKAASWGAPSAFNWNWNPEDIKSWEQNGKTFVLNRRTGLQLWLNYGLYQDFVRNTQRLDIEFSAHNIKIPLLIVHGQADETIPVDMALNLAKKQPPENLLIINETGHTFDAKHPWNEFMLPQAMQQATDYTIDFFNR